MSVLQSDSMLAPAREFVNAAVDYSFTTREREVLECFFSNTTRKVFFLQGLPTAVAASILAMYSRLKNPRGLRGHFVDHLLPYLAAALHPELSSWETGRIQSYLKEHQLAKLEAVLRHREPYDLTDGVKRFMEGAAEPTFWTEVAKSSRISDFLGMWLDTYGHNSIARTASAVFCCEDVSILTAKSLEWGRPGAGYIELSTRYVDFSRMSQYAAWRELEMVNATVGRMARENVEAHTAAYRELMGEKFDGPFPEHLRRWAAKYDITGKDLEQGVIGEACDVLANLLPCSTLTSLGIAVSGEAFPQLIKHLLLDSTPENFALAELIESEAKAAGLGHFLRHCEPTEWERECWMYLPQSRMLYRDADSPDSTAFRLLWAFGEYTTLPGASELWQTCATELAFMKRGDYDKLPSQFEVASAHLQGEMSFRGWRDLHRMGFCTHLRGRVTPLSGFYRYPKSDCWALTDAFKRAHSRDENLFAAMRSVAVPEQLAEQPMAMGNLIPYQIAANLREWEFCNWQRSKWGVNDEVRGEFLNVENFLRKHYPWWSALSRADTTKHYVFARGATPVAL